MRMIWNKGHRIRASDKHLVYHFSIGMLISEFYTPLVPKGHDFLQTIGRLAQERQTG